MKYIGTMLSVFQRHNCICQVIIWTPEGPISYASESLIVIFSPWYNCCVYVLNDNKMFLNWKLNWNWKLWIWYWRNALIIYKIWRSPMSLTKSLPLTCFGLMKIGSDSDLSFIWTLPDQYWFIDIWTFRNKLQWNLNQNAQSFILSNVFQLILAWHCFVGPPWAYKRNRGIYDAYMRH